MSERLKQYFPMIRDREEVMKEIYGSSALKEQFEEWTPEQQKEFLDICTGVKGVKVLYDAFFKEIMDPEYRPERLNRLLSLLLGIPVEVEVMLQNDSPRLAGEKSLLSMDLVVRLEDGSIANIEVQRIAYFFPGQRSATYSADLLLRQYRHVRKEFNRRKEGKWFDYRRLRNVYTIVLFENSPEEFQAYPDKYLHWFEQKSDTGLKMNLLQKYLFIPLDIFGNKIHNKDVTDETEAWLAFLSQDDPEIIVRVIEKYPEFRAMYEEIYRICRNMEDIMGIFSEELRILDENTIDNMIEEMQEEKERLAEENRNLETEKQNLETGNRKLEAEKHNLEAEKHNLEAEKRNLEAGNRNLEADRRSLETEKRNLEAALRQKEQEREAEHQRAEALARQMESMQRQLEELKHAMRQ